MSWTDPTLIYHVTHIKKIHIDEIRAALDGHIGLGGTTKHPNATKTVSGFMSSADKTLLDDLVLNAGTVLSVAGTAPIVSSGGTNPTISINVATTSTKGAMSSADKVKLDSINTSRSTTYSLPLKTSGGVNETISIDAATPSASGTMSATDKAKLDYMLTLPIGGIVIFYPPTGSITNYFDIGTGYGKSIAQGGLVDMSKYAICNGQNGTPDLRDRFVVGAGNKASGSIGGEAAHTLTVEELAPHKHDMVGNGTILRSPYNRTIERGKGDLSYSFETEETGGGQPHNNMPPYMALFYIMRIA